MTQAPSPHLGWPQDRLYLSVQEGLALKLQSPEPQPSGDTSACDVLAQFAPGKGSRLGSTGGQEKLVPTLSSTPGASTDHPPLRETGTPKGNSCEWEGSRTVWGLAVGAGLSSKVLSPGPGSGAAEGGACSQLI